MRVPSRVQLEGPVTKIDAGPFSTAVLANGACYVRPTPGQTSFGRKAGQKVHEYSTKFVGADDR